METKPRIRKLKIKNKKLNEFRVERLGHKIIQKMYVIKKMLNANLAN